MDNILELPREPSPETNYCLSIFPQDGYVVPQPFAKAIQELQRVLEMDVWLLVHSASEILLDDNLAEQFFVRRTLLPQNKPVALLLDSHGGIARAAYRIATIFQRHSSKFVVIVPRFAKSAGTLLALGAQELILGEYGELGPLDVQIYDPETERYGSGLNTVQTLERLQASSLEAIDKAMLAWGTRSGKKVNTLLPIACDFVSRLMLPLFEKVDAVDFTELSRNLKEAGDYAVRLLTTQYGYDNAEMIANHLIEHYATHDFIIDMADARSFGLNPIEASAELEQLFDVMHPFLKAHTFIGQLQEADKK